VVALWLTIEATPRTRSGPSGTFSRPVTRYPMNICSLGGEGPEPGVAWSLLDTGYARRLAERPVAEVAARLQSNWRLVTDPHTTTAQLVSLFALERPTSGMLRSITTDSHC